MKFPPRPSLSEMTDAERRAFELGHAVGLEAGLRMGWANAVSETRRAVESAIYGSRVPSAEVEGAIVDEAKREAGLMPAASVEGGESR